MLEISSSPCFADQGSLCPAARVVLGSEVKAQTVCPLVPLHSLACLVLWVKLTYQNKRFGNKNKRTSRLNSLSLSLLHFILFKFYTLLLLLRPRPFVQGGRERVAQASLLLSLTFFSFSLCRIVLFCFRISSHFHALKHCLSFSLFPVVEVSYFLRFCSFAP